MERGLVIHNAMQLSIPIWVVAAIVNNFPKIDVFLVSFVSVFGTLFPDIDHFSMWKGVKHNGFWSFVKFCVHADRYRKAFLPFHNHVAMLVVAVTAALFSFVNFFVFVFFLSFLIHLAFDYIADLYLIKQHTHWRLRNWFNGNSSGLSITQQVQQGDKQEYNS